MEIITDIRNFKKRPCAATIGSFDGLHLGHRAMIAQLREAAAKRRLPLVVVTFARHPRLLFDGECEPFLLTLNSEKEPIFEELGVDTLVLLDFDTCMASMCAERFMREVLVDALGVKLLGVGYDHHFGKHCCFAFLCGSSRKNIFCCFGRLCCSVCSVRCSRQAICR